MAKHTPGPWSVEEETGTFSVVNRDYDADGWDVAEVYHKQNVALIVAAPELLEAAEAIDKLSLVILSAVHFADPSMEDRMSTAILVARAAIAKATGETE